MSSVGPSGDLAFYSSHGKETFIAAPGGDQRRRVEDGVLQNTLDPRTKGRTVYVEGRIQTREWEDKDGNKQSRLRVVVENFQFIDSRGGGESRDDGGGRPAAAARSASAPARHDSPAEEDIPF